MINVTSHPILIAAYEVCLAIEKCKPVPEVVRASAKASNLLHLIDKYFKELKNDN